MVEHPSSHSDVKNPVIRRGSVDFIDVYEVKESELELLEKGLPATLDFNFAIFLFSSAITSVIALASSGFKSERVESIFIVFSIGAFIASLYLGFRWWFSRKSIKELVQTIRDRIDSAPDESRETPDMQALISSLQARAEELTQLARDARRDLDENKPEE